MKVMELIRDAEGGMKTHFLSLAKGLSAQGINVIALCNFNESSKRIMEDAGIHVIPFKISQTINPISDIIVFCRIVFLIKKNRPDILHCHGFKAGLLGRAACLITGVLSLYTVHNFVTYGRCKLSRKLIHSLEKWMAGKTDAIICVSNAIKKSLTENMGLEKNKLKVIRNSISEWPITDREKIRKSYNIEKDKFLIGSVARLIPSKGIDILLKAVPDILDENPGIRLMIVGSGPEEIKLKRLAAELGIESKVIFTGSVADIHNYYSAFDIFVLPTLSEGLGITILEAMSFGLPVLASAAGGITEVITHERNGILIEPGDINELRTALQFLLDNPAKAKQYGCRAKEDIKKTFANNRMIQETILVIKEIIRKKTAIRGNTL